MLTQNLRLNSKSSNKQFNMVTQIQVEEEQSIIQWIKQNFSQSFSNCRKVNKIQDLFNGVALAEMVSYYLNQDEKQIFLNQIQVIEKIQNNEDAEIAADNINASIIQLRDLFTRALRNLKNPKLSFDASQNLVQMVEFSLKYLQNFHVQSFVCNKLKMKNFVMQVIMILPEISHYFGSTKEIYQKLNKMKKLNNKQNEESGSILLKKHQKLEKSQQKNRLSSTKKKSTTNMKEMCNQNEPAQFFTNNIQQLSSIMGHSAVNYSSFKRNTKTQENAKTKNLKTLNDEYNDQKNKTQQAEQMYFKEQHKSQSQTLFENKVQKLLNWMQSAFNLQLSTFLEPHILLGQLVNSIFAPNRLKDNQKPIKPTHYQLGSYSVYKKALDFLTSVQRLNKNNLIKLMKQVEQGKVNENTFWSLVQDIYLMVKNKISQPLISVTKKPPRPQSVKKTTQQSQKLTTEYDENINIDNIRNQSVTDILRKQAQQSRKPDQLKDAPLYCQDTIKQTQLWLQNEMGMSHPLNKSKPQSKNIILENPLLNGTLYAKIIQRLKIGSAKGIITPLEKKHLKSNIDIVKNQLLNRGYECVRKLSIYKPTYNFYIGLLSEIRDIHQNKENNNKKLIINDKQKRHMEESQMEIPQEEKVELQKWLMEEYSLHFNSKNNEITLKQMKEVIESIVNVNFLKQTTQKIRFANYVKLFDFFKSIGFSHYSTIKVEDLLNDRQSNSKKSQNLRWMVLRDLKIIKGQK